LKVTDTALSFET